MDHPRGGVPIAEAADRLGVGVELLRKRAQRNTMPAYKVDGKWFVVLDVDQDGVRDIPPSPEETVPSRTVQDGTSRSGQDGEGSIPPPHGVSLAARGQLGAIRDEWLAPLVAQIREQAETIGGLRAERDVVAGERDRLRTERDTDRLLADRLVDLLQAERDEARARVAALEAAAGVPLPTAGSNGHGTPYGVVRWDDPAPGAVDAGPLVALAVGGFVRLLRLVGRVPGAVRGRG